MITAICILSLLTRGFCPTVDPNPVASASALEWFQKPAAVRYVGKYDRTYISWVTHEGKIQIRYYDNKTGNFSDIYTVDDLYPEYKIEARDDHNAPSLLILPTGRILIFYVVHDANNAFFMKTSVDAEDISAWSPRKNLSDRSSHFPYNYPQAKRLANGNILLFYRRGNYYNSNEYFKVSADNGRTWKKAVKLVDFGSDGIYAVVYTKGNRIHVAWHESIATPIRKNIYYMASSDGGATWEKKDGKYIKLPATRSSADLVFDSGNEPGNVWDIVADGNNEPFIVFAYKNNPDHEFRFARWSGSSWISDKITGSAQLYDSGHFYSGGIVIDPKNVYEVYLSKKHGRLEIERWTSFDKGISWKKTETVTENSGVDNFRLQLVENYSDNLRLIWASGIYDGLIGDQWTGYDRVNIQSEVTKASIPRCFVMKWFP